MRIFFIITVFVAISSPVSVSANSRIKIDTVPATYTPYLSSLAEPVSLRGFRFEVNETTRHARLLATYTYTENMIVGADDGAGPRETIVQIPGLVYDAQSHAVVYNSDGTRTICAVLQESKGLWGRHLNVKSTGACTVSTELAGLIVDDGWDLHHLKVMNSYFEVH